MRKLIFWIVGTGLTILTSVWALVRPALDWLGRSTAIDDWDQLVNDSLPDALVWLFTTPSWVPALCALAFTVATIWLMFRMQEAVPTGTAKARKNPAKSVAFLPKLNPDSGVIPYDGEHEFDLVLRSEETVYAEGNRSDDGIDMAVRVVLRNRSRTPVWLAQVRKAELTFDGTELPNSGGGISIPFRPETDQGVVFGGTRVYNEMEGKKGRGRVSYLFGQNEAGARWILDVDVEFRILGDPQAKRRTERIAVEILKNRTVYRPKPES